MRYEQRKKNLLLEVQSLIAEIEKHNKASEFTGLLQVFLDLQMHLNQEKDINFRWYSFAIFRTITDDANLESSEIGQRLMRFSESLQKISGQ